MAATQETLTISVNYDGKAASQGLKNLRDDVEAIERASRSQGFQNLKGVADSMTALGQAASGLQGIGPSFQNVAQSAESLFNTFKSFDPQSYATKITAVTSALTGISGALGSFSKIASSLEKMSKFAADPKLSQNFQTMSQQIVAFAQSVTSNISDDVLTRFERLGAAMAGLSSGGGGYSMTTLAGSAISASTAFSGLGSNMKKVISYGWQISKMPLKMILSPVQSIGKGLSDMTTRFKSFLSGIGRIALYRAIRTGIKLVTTAVREGVNNLYIWADMVGNSFKPTMDSLASSFMYLKNSIGAAVSPLLDALAPALETVVNQIVDVLNIFNQVIATMTGASTWRKAIRSAASYSDNISGLGHNAEDATDAVKELKRTILGFDEINKLDDKTKTTTPKDNGSNATGYYGKKGAFSFTEVPISSTAKNIADMLKKAWENADFTELGTALAKKIADALMSVPWEEKIKPAVVKLAKSFGTFLNGMFDYTGEGGKALWDAIAYTIYNALNTAILGYVTFFDTVHWEGIGQGIGAALRQVLENIDWNMLSDALAAFPNAVIDLVTGFTRQMTVSDFYDAGANIGRTISSALTKINWKGLFGNAVTIATSLLSALNGALENFDWSGVKDAILNGIKSINKKNWNMLGAQIGRAIVNVADFIANLVDVFVKAIEAGKWSSLIEGIKNGINDRVKEKYGGWNGVAKNIAEWFGEHIGTLEIILALAFGLPLLKALPAAFATSVMGAINLKRVPGTGMTLGAWVKGLSIAAGIVLAIDTIKTALSTDFNKGNLKEFLGNTLNIACRGAIAGALVGFGVGGFIGGAYGIIIGAGIALSIGVIKSMVDNLKTGNTADFLAELGGGIAGAIVGFTFAGPIGALLGFSIGAILTLKFKEIISDFSEAKTGSGSQFDFGGGSFASGTGYSEYLQNKENGNKDNTPNRAGIEVDDRDRVGAADTMANKSATLTFKAELDPVSVNNAWSNLSQWWSNLTKTNKVAQFVTEGVKNDSPSWWTLVKQYWGTETSDKKAQSFTVEGIYDRASEWWTSVQQYWSRMISGKNAQRFTTEGVVNQSPDWWSQLTGFWSKYITGKNAQRFTTEGVENKSGEWWNQLLGYWKNYITGKNAKRFTTEGVQDQSHTWWNQVTGFWNTIISHNKANEFSIAGVVNDAYEWWYQTEGYWDNATRYSTLDASVSIGNPWSAFCDAWNDMQSYFNSNHLTAYVETQRVGGGDDAIVSEATGGVFKNGHWEAIQKFAAGGMPTGELFIAREAGPELVGTLGGDAAVMNNDQIVASVSAGVARAVASVMGSGSNNPIEFTFKVDSETLYRVVRRGEKKASGRYGTVVALG